jgi:hypothetical protein
MTMKSLPRHDLLVLNPLPRLSLGKRALFVQRVLRFENLRGLLVLKPVPRCCY